MNGMRPPKILVLTWSFRLAGSAELKKFAGMRNSNEQSLSEVIFKMMKDYHLEEGMLEIRIQEAWNGLMDPAILQRTASVKFEKGELKIRTSSSVLAHELEYQKEEIKNAINAVLRTDAIQSVDIR
jgi:hypothetical protein